MAKSNIDKLMELKQLYEQGILTKEEMEVEKAKILNASTSPDESPINEAPPVEAIGSSLASTSDNKRHSHNNKIIIGVVAIAAVIIAAFVVLYLNKQKEPKEVAKDNVELSQQTSEVMEEPQKEEEVTDFYKECISIEQVFAVKDNDTSDKLVSLLKNLYYIHKESEYDNNSGDWEKNITIDGASSKVIVRWETGRYDLFYLVMECTEDTIAKRWLSEIKNLGYKIKKTNSDKSQETWVGEKSENDWVAIYHDKIGNKYSLSTRASFSVAYGTYEEAEKKAAQKEQKEIQEIESQAISLETVIDAYKNNVDGRADNIFYKQEKIYQFNLRKIRKSSSDYEYVMEGSGYSHGDLADILVYTDDSQLTNLNFPVKLCFRGTLVSIGRPEYGERLIYHFVCTEALTYRY